MDNNASNTNFDLKKLQSVLLSILTDFDLLCRKNDIEYSLAFGTEIGAVRHQGFIPWDDDIDVHILIEDYRKFEESFKRSDLCQKYFLQSKENDEWLPSPFFRLRKNGTVSVDPGYEKMPINWGIPLDIFPLYHVKDNWISKKLVSFYAKKIRKYCIIPWNNSNCSNHVFVKSVKMTKKYLKAIEKISNKNKKSRCVYFCGLKNIYFYDINVFYPTRDIIFEKACLKTMPNYDFYLKSIYGNYMKLPPVEKREYHAVSIFDLNHDINYYKNKNSI